MNFSLQIVAMTVQAICGSGALRHEVVVDAPVAEVWAAFATKEGVESWMVAHGEVDLRVGGKMRTHYDPNGALGDPNTIENTILSFEPMRMISIKATKPPENFPFKKSIEGMWTVIYLDELGPERTRVTCVGMGYGDDEESQKLREHFDKGNALTMDKLRQHFTGRKSSTSAEEAERVVQAIGGEWTLNHSRPDGSMLRGRMSVEPLMDGKFVLVSTWLGTGDKPKPHGHAVFGSDPLGGGYRMWDFGDRGKVSAAPVKLVDGNRLIFDWTMHMPEGGTQRFYIEDILEDRDSLHVVIYALKPGETFGEKPRDREPMVDVVWKRNDVATERPHASGDASASPAALQVRVSAKRINKDVTIAAPLKQVWEAWTTAEGARTFFAQDAKVELRVGGPYEMYFGKDAPAGARGSEGCHVLSFLPTEMLSFSWSAPPQWPEIRKERTLVVVRLEDLGEKGTRVKLAHTGFGDDADWDAVHEYFENAWDVVLNRLDKRFADGKASPSG